jgi:hypothetical protein
MLTVFTIEMGMTTFSVGEKNSAFYFDSVSLTGKRKKGAA